MKPFVTMTAACLALWVGLAGCVKEQAPNKKAAKESFDRGYAAVLNNDLDKAILEYTEAIRLDPNYAWAYTHRAVAFFKKGDVDRAIAQCEKALKYDRK